MSARYCEEKVRKTDHRLGAVNYRWLNGLRPLVRLDAGRAGREVCHVDVLLIGKTRGRSTHTVVDRRRRLTLSVVLVGRGMGNEKIRRVRAGLGAVLV